MVYLPFCILNLQTPEKPTGWNGARYPPPLLVRGRWWELVGISVTCEEYRQREITIHRQRAADKLSVDIARWKGMKRALNYAGLSVTLSLTVLLLAQCNKKSSSTSGSDSGPGASFLYLPDATAGNIRGFGINSTTGKLTEITASPFATLNTPYGGCADPQGVYYFVPDYGANKIYAFSVDSDGALTAATGSPTNSGTSAPYQCKVSPDGSHLYVTHYLSVSAAVSAWTINRSTGALTQVSGSPFATDDYAMALNINTAGTFLYSTSFNYDIRAWAINASTGALSAVSGSPFNITYTAMSLLIHPLDTFLYAIQGSFGRISYHTMDGSTGALGAEQGSNSATQHYYGSCRTPDGSKLYAINYDGTINGFTVNNTTGALTSSTSVVVSNPYQCDITNDGAFLYVTSTGTNKLHGYAIDSTTGALTELDDSPFTINDNPQIVSIFTLAE